MGILNVITSTPKNKTIGGRRYFHVNRYQQRKSDLLHENTEIIKECEKITISHLEFAGL